MCENIRKTTVCGLKLQRWQNQSVKQKQSADVFVFFKVMLFRKLEEIWASFW